jgi:hypothetical protein
MRGTATSKCLRIAPCETNSSLPCHKSPAATNLTPQLLSQHLVFLETLEEIFEEANDDGVDANAFGFGPLFER